MGELTKSLRDFLRPTVRVAGLLSAAVMVCCVATVSSFFGDAWWPFELTTHFRVQYALVLISAGMILVPLRRYWIAVISMLFALPNVALIAPLYMADHSSSTGSTSTKAAFMNLSVSSESYGSAGEFVRRSDPEFFGVVELSEAWLVKLREQLKDYPSVVSRTRDDEFGIGLFSKTALEDPAVLDLGTLGFPAIKAYTTVDERRLTIFVVHPPPPVFTLFREERIRQMKNLAALVVKEKNVVVLGDLNMTMWSPIFRDLVSSTGLQDGRKGFGIQATWPTTIPWLLIPVDHCLVSNRLRVTRFAAGPKIGSDHYPLVVELGGN